MARLLLKDKDNRVSTDGSALHGWSARLCRPSQKSQKKQHSFSTPTSWPTQLTTGDKNRKKNKARKAQVRTNTKRDYDNNPMLGSGPHLHAPCAMSPPYNFGPCPSTTFASTVQSQSFCKQWRIWWRDWNLIKNPIVPTIIAASTWQILHRRLGFVWRIQLRLLFSFLFNYYFLRASPASPPH